jgi:hypothetical protein
MFSGYGVAPECDKEQQGSDVSTDCTTTFAKTNWRTISSAMTAPHLTQCTQSSPQSHATRGLAAALIMYSGAISSLGWQL